MTILTARGKEAAVELHRDHIVIKRKAAFFFNVADLIGDTYIPLSSIKAVQIRRPASFANGFIKFTVLGTQLVPIDKRGNTRDPNIIPFHANELAQFEALAEAVNAAIQTPSIENIVLAAASRRGPDHGSSQMQPISQTRQVGAPTRPDVIDIEPRAIPHKRGGTTAASGASIPVAPQSWWDRRSVLSKFAIIMTPIMFFLIIGSLPPGDNSDSGDPVAQPSQTASAVASGTSAAVASDADDTSGDGKSYQGRCYMDTCGWFKVKNVKLIKEDGDRRLYRVKLFGGESPNSDDAQKRAEPKWQAQPYYQYVSCAANNPTVMTKVDGKWQVDQLDFVTGIPGALEDNATLYSLICYGDDGAWLKDDFVSSHGISAPPSPADDAVPQRESITGEVNDLHSGTPHSTQDQ